MAELVSSVFSSGVRSVLPVLPSPLLAAPPAAAAIFLPPAPARVNFALTFEDAATEDAYRTWTWARTAVPARLSLIHI